MNFSGQLLTRLNKINREYLGKKGVIFSVTSVNAAPEVYAGNAYQVAIVEFEDGLKRSFMVTDGVNLSIGQACRINLKLGFVTEKSLRVYIPKVEACE